MKLLKMTCIFALVVLFLVVLATSASAYTNQDLMSYITGTHTINGSQYSLSESQKAEAREYLQSHPVTDSEAAQIKADLDAAKAKIEATGATSLSQVNATTKSEVVSLIEAAGNVAGVDVNVNTEAETITIVDKSTGVVISGGSYASTGTGGLTVKYSSDNGLYSILYGAGQTYNTNTHQALLIRASGDLSKFVSVKVDDVVLEKSNYTVKSGSTLVELQPAYLANLASGTHKVTISFVDGEVSTNITIDKSALTDPGAANAGSSSGSTASNGGRKTFVYTGANNTVFVIMAVLSVVAVSTVYLKKSYAK